MIRLLGGILVASGMTFLGFCAARELTERVYGIETMIDGLNQLRRELKQRGRGLPELLEQLSQQTALPAATLFQQCAQGCCHLDERTLAENWQDGVKKLRILSKETQMAMGALGVVLGRYEVSGQCEAIAQVVTILEEERTKAKEEQRRLGKVYQVLGLTGGTFLTILLL